MEPQIKRDGGGVVLGDGGTIALVRARGGDGAFLFPKGKIEEGESAEEAARREIAEEAGLHDLEYIADLGVMKRFAINPDGSDNTGVMIETEMFLFAASRGAILAPTMEMDAAKWVPYRELGAANGSKAEVQWFSSVFERVREAIQRD